MINRAIMWMALAVFGIYVPTMVMLCLKTDRENMDKEQVAAHSPLKVMALTKVNAVVRCGYLYWPAVILTLWKVLNYPDVMPTDFFSNMPLWWSAVAVSTLVLCMAAFVAVIVKVLLQSMALLEEVFEVFVDTIENSSGELDWDKLAVDVHGADVQAAEMLKMTHTGSLVVLNVLAGGMIMAMTTWVMLVVPPSNPLFGAAVYGLTLGVGQAFGVLFMLAKLTSIIKNVAVMARSVHAAARRYPAQVIDESGRRRGKGGEFACEELELPFRRRVAQMSSEEKAAHSRFMSFIMFSPLGAEVFGVPISKQFLTQQFAKVAVVIPTFIGVMRHLAAQAVQHDEGH